MYLAGEQEAMRRRLAKRRIEVAVKPKPRREPRKYKTYFILGQMTEKIKIGRSFDPSKRMADLQIGSPDTLVLLAVVDGDKERRYHKMFRESHSHGEWYFSKDILTYLKGKFNQFIQ